MDNLIKHRLQDKSISDLNAMLEMCKKMSKFNMKWAERAEWIEAVLLNKIEYVFET